MISLKDLKIAFFSGTMIEGQDGVTRTLYKIVDYFEELGIKMRFYTADFYSKDKKIDIYKVDSIPLLFYKDYKLPIPSKLKLEKNLDEFQPDIIHFHSPCPLGYFAAKYAKKRNIPLFSTYHTHFTQYLKYYKFSFAEIFVWEYFKKLYNSCDLVFLPSRSLLKDLVRHRIRNLYYLPNGIDLDKFSPKFKNENFRQKWGIPNDKKILLFVGRLVWEKDLKLFFEIDKILSQNRNDYIFLFVGDGPAREELEKGLKNAVFTGKLFDRDLAEAYASSDVFVFPSTTETFGLVVLEAMASALPVVCANIYGPSTIIHHKFNGLKCIPNNAVDFANKIEILLDFPKFRRYIINNALNDVRHYEWKHILNIMLQKYFEVYLQKSATKNF